MCKKAFETHFTVGKITPNIQSNPKKYITKDKKKKKKEKWQLTEQIVQRMENTNGSLWKDVQPLSLWEKCKSKLH